jgi:TonB family protein
MKISIHIARGPGADLVPTFASSLFFHLIVFFSLPFLPSFLPSGPQRPSLYVVDLVELPPLREPGGPAKEDPGSLPPATEDPAEQTPEPKQPEPPPEPQKPEPEPEPQPEPVKKKEPEKKPPVKKEVVRRTPPVEPESTTPTGSPDAADPTDPGGTPDPGGPGTGPGGGIGVPGGTGTAGFDDASFRFAYYRVRMRNILRTQWSKPLYPPNSRETYRAVVHFVIARDGTILNLELREPSGHQPLDISALRAVRDTGRMPPLPLQYDKDRVGVTYIFELRPEQEPSTEYRIP